MSEPAMKWNGGEGDAAKSADAILPQFLRSDTRTSKTSKIEVQEIEDAKKVVENAWLMASKGKPLTFTPCGYKMLIKLYVRPEELKEIVDATGEKKVIYLPDSVRAEDKFHSCSGLVVAMGDECYTGQRKDGSPRYPNGPWSRVGDVIVLDRYAGKRVTINGVACMIINDDQVDGVISDPSDIEAGHSEHRI